MGYKQNKKKKTNEPTKDVGEWFSYQWTRVRRLEMLIKVEGIWQLLDVSKN